VENSGFTINEPGGTVFPKACIPYSCGKTGP
jgi:hypothetical protein